MRHHARDARRVEHAGRPMAGRHPADGAVPLASAIGNRRMGRLLSRVAAGSAPAASVATGPRRPRRRSATRTRGGSILYVGMNEFAPELRQLGLRYKPGVTGVTAGKAEHDAHVGNASYDLTSRAGIEGFAASLPLYKAQKAQVVELMHRTHPASRDELAHLTRLYAITDFDGEDRMSRIVLSGHSSDGSRLFSGDARLGGVELSALRMLGSICPRAARQPRHLIVMGCYTGAEGVGKAHFQQAFPNLRTWWAWTRKAPSGKGAARALAHWSRLTDADPDRLPVPPKGQANWSAAAGYQSRDDRADRTTAMGSLRDDEDELFAYFSGEAIDSGQFLNDYYARARVASQAVDLSEDDRAYALQHAEQAYRLRFWPAMVAHFWEKNKDAIQRGYGPVPAPDFGRMSRSEAVGACYAFGRMARGPERDRAEARRLLGALHDLDPAELDYRWIEPPSRARLS